MSSAPFAIRPGATIERRKAPDHGRSVPVAGCPSQSATMTNAPRDVGATIDRSAAAECRRGHLRDPADRGQSPASFDRLRAPPLPDCDDIHFTKACAGRQTRARSGMRINTATSARASAWPKWCGGQGHGEPTPLVSRGSLARDLSRIWRAVPQRWWKARATTSRCCRTTLPRIQGSGEASDVARRPAYMGLADEVDGPLHLASPRPEA